MQLEYPFDRDSILKEKRKIRKELIKKENLLEKKIAILAGATVGEFKNILEIFLLNHGIKPIFWIGQYNCYYEEVMFENDIFEFDPDIVYIHTSYRNIEQFPEYMCTKEMTLDLAKQEMSKFVKIWDKLLGEIKCPVIQNNFELPPYRVMGNAECYREDGQINYIHLLNSMMVEYKQNHSEFYINDLLYEAARFGLEKWYDNSKWCMYKYPYAIEAIPNVAHNLSNIIKSLFGKNKKALVLDLDNTLWGGIIGDDGVEGIKLGIDSPEGMIYEEIQKYIKKLYKLGVVLNIASKNTEEIAKSGFEHPSSILKLNDFYEIKANWERKDLNIQEIIRSMNIMDEAIVFLDDNPIEREMVSKSLPSVAIPKLTYPEEYLKILDGNAYFEITHLSKEDSKRNDYYASNKIRNKLLAEVEDYDTYLKSLKMKVSFEDGKNHIERITQLINKTNQFNLTTVRYTIEDLKNIIMNPNKMVIAGKLTDKFGENGLVTCVVGSWEEETLIIDLWIMSCRVFKRKLEDAVFDFVVRKCKEKRINKIIGKYYRTKKNEMVKHFYKEYGFEVVIEDEEHGIWEYTIPENYEERNEIMEVEINE